MSSQNHPWQRDLMRQAQAVGMVLDETCFQSIIRYTEELQLWNRRYALIGPGMMSRFYSQSLPEALWLAGTIRTLKVSTIADLGSGAGIPGIPVALFLAGGDEQMTLIEPRAKKARFLRHAVATFNLNNRVTVEQNRSDQIAPDRLGSGFDLVFSKALGDLLYGTTVVAPILESRGRYLALKGEGVSREVARFQASDGASLFEDPVVHPLPSGGCCVEMARCGG